MRVSAAFVLLPLLSVSLSACPEERPPPGDGADTPQAAVVAWLAAVHAGDFERAAALSPPGLSAEGLDELAADLEARLGGARRDEARPFSMGEPEGGRTLARVHLERDGAQLPVDLSLEAHDGRWFVVPPRVGEVKAY